MAHYADVVKERVSTAWDLAKPTALAAYDAALTAATGAADRLEPMSAKVMVMQAGLSSSQWLSLHCLDSAGLPRHDRSIG